MNAVQVRHCDVIDEQVIPDILVEKVDDPHVVAVVECHPADALLAVVLLGLPKYGHAS